MLDESSKEVCRKSVSDIKGYKVGKEATIGNYDIYIDNEKENKSGNITSSFESSSSKVNTVPDERTGLIGLSAARPVALLPARKFTLQPSKPVPKPSPPSSPTYDESDITIPPKIHSLSALLSKPLTSSSSSSANNTTNKTQPNEPKIQNFFLKNLKPHQLIAAEFLLTCLIGKKISPTFYEACNITSKGQNYDRDSDDNDEKDVKLYGAILADEVCTAVHLIYFSIYIHTNTYNTNLYVYMSYCLSHTFDNIYTYWYQ